MHDPFPDQYCAQRYDKQCYHCDNVFPVGSNRKMARVALPILDGYGHCVIRFTEEREGKGRMFGFTLFADDDFKLDTPGYPAFAICYYHPAKNPNDPDDDGTTGLAAFAELDAGKKSIFSTEDMIDPAEPQSHGGIATKRQLPNVHGCADSHFAPNSPLAALTYHANNDEYVMYVPIDDHLHLVNSNNVLMGNDTDILCLHMHGNSQFPTPGLATCGHCDATVSSVSVNVGHCQITIQHGDHLEDFYVSASEGTKQLYQSSLIYNVACFHETDVPASTPTPTYPTDMDKRALEARSTTKTVVLSEYVAESKTWTGVTWTDTYGDVTTTTMAMLVVGSVQTTAYETYVYTPLAEPHPAKKREADVKKEVVTVRHDGENGLHQNGASEENGASVVDFHVMCIGFVFSAVMVAVLML